MTTGTLKQVVSTVSALPGKGNEAEMVVTTSSPDRDGDRIIPTGADLSNFRRNSPLLWAHDHRSLPIGTVTSVNIGRDGLRARWRWLDGDDFAERVKNAWAQGVIRAASIGFIPGRSTRNDYGGRDILEWELLEVSLVPIGANPEAVRALKAFGRAAPTWTPASVGRAAAEAFERLWSGSERPVLLIEDEGEPVLHVSGLPRPRAGEEVFRVDLDAVDRQLRSVIAEQYAGLVASAVKDEVNYYYGRID